MVEIHFSQPENHAASEVFWPASRARAATRGLVFLAGAVSLGIISFIVYGSLHLGPGVAGSRLVDYGVALAAAPLPILTIVCAWRAARWLLLSLWPKQVGVRAKLHTLALELGPFGTRAFDVDRLDVKYPFEFSGDFEDGGFEAFLPKQEQVAQMLPRLSHPQAREPLRQTILRYAAGTEPQIAAAFLPVVLNWRATKGLSMEEDDADDA